MKDLNIMAVFDVIIIAFGIYMTVLALQMKKSGKISAAVITKEEIDKCKDKKGFIQFIYWKEALFGGVIILVGILGIVNDLFIYLGIGNIVKMLVFLGMFLWFQNEMRKAREKFIH